ncbi:hypothetical protein BDB01DRAFT_837938 [Pilobolus umbonatus]|nr:hypothetical protein BDB01DRAFT_837938 [Pilobolus umbonatus]
MSVASTYSDRAFFASRSPSPNYYSPHYQSTRSPTPEDSDEENVTYAHEFYDNRSDDSHDTVPNDSGISAGRSTQVQGLNQGNIIGSVSFGPADNGSESSGRSVSYEVAGPSVEGDNLLLNDYLNKLCAEQTPNEESYNEIPYESHFAESEEIEVDDCMVLDDPMDIDYPPLWWVVPMELDDPMDID